MTKNLQGGNEKRSLLRRILIYGAAIFILGILQCSFFSRLKPFGAVPDIMLGALCAIALLDGKGVAIVSSVCAGYFIDALGTVSPSFSPLFYLVCAVVSALLAEKLIPKFISFALSMLPLLALKAIYTLTAVTAAYGELPALSAALSLLLSEAISTAVICVPVYFVIKLCTIPICARSKFSF